MPRLAGIRELTLARPPARGRPRHLSAASGLVRVGTRYFVIADDEHHLGVFPALSPDQPGELVRVLPGSLPSGPKKRKRRKPDFEALVALPPFRGYPHGALWALGSGSRTHRRGAVLLALDVEGAVGASISRVDLAPWFDRLAREFDEVNIEGAYVDGGHLFLLHRGNKASERNARIRIALAPTLAALATGEPLSPAALIEATDFELGDVEGVPLCFTDGCALAGGAFAFTAVAEDTGDSYADGPCVGAALGIIDGSGRVSSLWHIGGALKPEGIEARRTSRGLELTVVTDADDARIPARMFAATLPTP